MKNIYFRNSKLSSWCLRLLIERYVAGDTALEAKRFIDGVPKTDGQGNVLKDDNGFICWVHESHLEPSHPVMEEHFDASLLSCTMDYTELANYANNRAAMYPDYWKEIKISRVTVNRYFLLLGKFCWENVVAHKYYRDAKRTAEIARKTHKIRPEFIETWPDIFVRRYIKEAIMWANGTLLKEKAKYVCDLPMMPYLIQRSKKFNGLKLKYAHEHVAWAAIIGENEGRNYKRSALAFVLASDILKKPLPGTFSSSLGADPIASFPSPAKNAIPFGRGFVKNIYCPNSKISSWCLRLLIERYVAGDTAPEAKKFIDGVPKTDDQGNMLKDATGNICWVHEPHLEPYHIAMKEYFNTFLSSHPMHYQELANHANERAETHPSFWKEIKISSVTINRYFLLLGKYCWENHVGRKYYRDAKSTAEIARKTHKNLLLESNDTWAEVFVRRSIKESIMWANGTLTKEKAKFARDLPMLPYLKQRAKKFNGLKLKYAREHVAWAALVTELEGRDLKRTAMACGLASDILDKLLKA